MKRQKQIVLFGLIIVLGIFVYLWNNGYYLTMEQALHADERLTHFNESEEILINYENSEGLGIVAGETSKGIFVTQTERKGPFVRIRGGMIFTDVTAYFDADMKAVYGYMACEDAESLYYYFNGVGAFFDDEQNLRHLEKTVVPGKNNFFVVSYYDVFKDKKAGTMKDTTASRIVCKDADGNEVYKYVKDLSGSGSTVETESYWIVSTDASLVKKNPHIKLQHWNDNKYFYFYYDAETTDYFHGPYAIKDDILICENFRFRIIDDKRLEYLGDGIGGNIAGVDAEIGAVFELEE